jgi:hypothetical protein
MRDFGTPQVYGVTAVVALPARGPVRAVGQRRHSSCQARIPSRSLRMRKNSFGACSLSMARCWLSAGE